VTYEQTVREALRLRALVLEVHCLQRAPCTGGARAGEPCYCLPFAVRAVLARRETT
jgi:hypothetical protein